MIEDYKEPEAHREDPRGVCNSKDELDFRTDLEVAVDALKEAYVCLKKGLTITATWKIETALDELNEKRDNL